MCAIRIHTVERIVNHWSRTISRMRETNDGNSAVPKLSLFTQRNRSENVVFCNRIERERERERERNSRVACDHIGPLLHRASIINSSGTHRITNRGISSLTGGSSTNRINGRLTRRVVMNYNFQLCKLLPMCVICH